MVICTLENTYNIRHMFFIVISLMFAQMRSHVFSLGRVMDFMILSCMFSRMFSLEHVINMFTKDLCEQIRRECWYFGISSSGKEGWREGWTFLVGLGGGRVN